MFRIDPKNTSLHPPPHPLWVFVKSNFSLLMLVVPVVGLILHLTDQRPVTRLEIVLIAVDVGSIVVLIMMQVISGVIGTIERINHRHPGLIEKTVDAMSGIASGVEGKIDPKTPNR